MLSGTVSRLIPVTSEIKTGCEERKSSGAVMPAVKYFFMLAAGSRPASEPLVLHHLRLVEDRLCLFVCNPDLF